MLAHDFVLIKETNANNFNDTDYLTDLLFHDKGTRSTTIIDKCVIDDDLILYNLDLFEKLPILKIDPCTNLIGLAYFAITVIPRSSFFRLAEISEIVGADELSVLLDQNIADIDDDCYIVHGGI
jgi:hypothetical protein